jgi:hypothetical protein
MKALFLYPTFQSRAVAVLARGFVFAGLAMATSMGWAQPLDRQLQGLHPWQAPRVSSQAEAYFTNLSNDAKIETPFVVKFGLSDGWGLAPIAVPMSGKSGHHHLLINRELPLDFKQPLPFNDQYIHFGKGQMESVLNLAPGIYNLRLLLADDKHLPHFVYSKPMRITVTKQNAALAKPAGAGSIELLNVAQDAKLRSPFRLQFHASGLQVAHQAQKLKDTGHFRLSLTPRAGGKGLEMDFTNGQTEVWLQPPPGAYTAKLQLLDNLQPSKILAEAPARELAISN